MHTQAQYTLCVCIPHLPLKIFKCTLYLVKKATDGRSFAGICEMHVCTCAKVLHWCWTLWDPMYCNQSRNAPGACPGDSTPRSHPPPWRPRVASRRPTEGGKPATDVPRRGLRGSSRVEWLAPPRLTKVSESLRLRPCPGGTPSFPAPP